MSLCIFLNAVFEPFYIFLYKVMQVSWIPSLAI